MMRVTVSRLATRIARWVASGAAVLLCVAGGTLTTAVPAAAAIVTLSPNGLGGYGLTSGIYYWESLTGSPNLDVWEGSSQVYAVDSSSGAWSVYSTNFSSEIPYVVFFYSYDFLDDYRGAEIYFPKTFFYEYIVDDVYQTANRQYQATYSSYGWTNRTDVGQSLYVIYRLNSNSFTTAGGYFVFHESERPDIILDTGNDPTYDEAVEAAVEENTAAVEENTDAIEQMREDLLSTEGSDSVVSGVLGDGDSDSWLLDRLGFIGTLIEIPYAIVEAFMDGSADGTFTFPGISFEPFMSFSLPATEVDVWGQFPSGVVTTIRASLTMICVLLWVSGCLSLYRRFTGEEQTVQIEGAR